MVLREPSSEKLNRLYSILIGCECKERLGIWYKQGYLLETGGDEDGL